jgi:hypothetical protein
MAATTHVISHRYRYIYPNLLHYQHYIMHQSVVQLCSLQTGQILHLLLGVWGFPYSRPQCTHILQLPLEEASPYARWP